MMMVLAIGLNGEVGFNNDMPWGLNQKSDLAHFKNLTHGGVVIMGRHTYESIGKPLPGRTNIVVSRAIGHIEGCLTVDSVDKAREIANQQNNPVFVIGGASLFEQMIKDVDQVYLTIIESEFHNADVHFDKDLLSTFTLQESEPFEADERNTHSYRFEVWRKTV